MRNVPAEGASELILMLDRLNRRASHCIDRSRSEKTPGVEHGITEVLEDRPMIGVGARLMDEVLHPLALVGSRDTAGLDLKLIDRVDRKRAVDDSPITLLVYVVHGDSVDVGLVQIALTTVHLVHATSASHTWGEVDESSRVARLASKDQRQG